MSLQSAIPRFIFATRWVQLPLYIGLIAAQAVYVVHFWIELMPMMAVASLTLSTEAFTWLSHSG